MVANCLRATTRFAIASKVDMRKVITAKMVKSAEKSAVQLSEAVV